MRVSAVVLEGTKTGRARRTFNRRIFIFVGFAPTSSRVPAGIKVSPTGYVITDEKCETCIPGIFAIGDLRQKYANQILSRPQTARRPLPRLIMWRNERRAKFVLGFSHDCPAANREKARIIVNEKNY